MLFKRLFSTFPKSLANNYNPLPISIIRGKDCYLWDKNDKKYLDLLAGYAVLNQGHCHPLLVETMIKECQKLTSPSRMVMTQNLEEWADFITNKFNYEKVLPMNTGSEAIDTVLKISRKYAFQKFNNRNPKIIVKKGNYHGRTIGATSLSDNINYKYGFEPLNNNIISIDFNDSNQLLDTIQKYDNSISAILYEPIQGEGGTNIISDSFYDTLKNIKSKYPHILLISDEIQCGLGRTGCMKTSDYSNLIPDILVLGKALSGGFIPMSCVLSSENIMSVMNGGIHGSTFGGNPLGCAISVNAIKIIQDECIDNVEKISNYLINYLSNILSEFDCVKEIRGMGLMIAIEFTDDYNLDKLRFKLLEDGIIIATSRGNCLRITPPLTITNFEIDDFIQKFYKAI